MNCRERLSMINSPELFFFSVSAHFGTVFLQQVGLFTLTGMGESAFFFSEAEEVKTIALLVSSIAHVPRISIVLFFMVVVKNRLTKILAKMLR